MTKKCPGCGAVLQDNNVLLDGFTTNLTNTYCARCFRMKNYGEYQMVTKSNLEFIEILKSINRSKNLVLYVVDLLNVPRDLGLIRKYLGSSEIILVLNKRDVLPYSLVDEKIIDYFKEMNLGFLDIVIISALKDYNLDLLYSKIKKYRFDRNVYVVGYTNAGKSMLINKFMKNYMAADETLSISAMPSTTLNEIKMQFGDFYIIDTPGLVDIKNMINYVDVEMLKKISPKKEIKPKVFQIKKNQSIIIDNLIRLDYVEGEKNSIVVYASNELNIKRINSRHNELKDLNSLEFDVLYRQDVVVNGLGFFRISDACKVTVWINKEVEVFTRKSLI